MKIEGTKKNYSRLYYKYKPKHMYIPYWFVKEVKMNKKVYADYICSLLRSGKSINEVAAECGVDADYVKMIMQINHVNVVKKEEKNMKIEEIKCAYNYIRNYIEKVRHDQIDNAINCYKEYTYDDDDLIEEFNAFTNSYNECMKSLDALFEDLKDTHAKLDAMKEFLNKENNNDNS